MTEQEWQACEESRTMLGFVWDTGIVSERKARLFAVACCRRIWTLITDERARSAVELAEKYADGLAAGEELLDPWPTDHLRDGIGFPWPAKKVFRCAWDAAWLSAAKARQGLPLDLMISQAAYYAAGAVAWHVAGAAESSAKAEAWAAAWNRAEADEYGKQSELLRDILGNPFRPIAVKRDWLSPTVVRLAHAIYDERTFGRMLSLADALQEAGCTHAEILAHCRQPGPHVRGCWLVDLLLGKS